MTKPIYRVICKLESCQKEFETKRKNQSFHSDKCRQLAFQHKKRQADYERGWDDAIRVSAEISKTYEERTGFDSDGVDIAKNIVVESEKYKVRGA